MIMYTSDDWLKKKNPKIPNIYFQFYDSITYLSEIIDNILLIRTMTQNICGTDKC